MSKIRQLIRKIIPTLPKFIRRNLALAGIEAGNGLKEFIRYPSLEGTLKYLEQKGFEPEFVIDVGAFRGEWTTEFKSVFPKASVLMIEAQQNKKAGLWSACQKFNGSVDLEIALLGAQDGVEVTFHEVENASSVFQEQGFAVSSPTTRTLTRLDTLLVRANKLERIDFLKLDVQGYEIEVLKGAEETLARTEFVLLEASLIQINKGCPLAIEVLNFMAAHKFRWLDFCGQWRRPDHFLWQVDLLFVRNDSKFVPDASLDGSTFPG